MEVFLMVNGHEFRAPVDEQERIILKLAAGQLSRDAFLEWVNQHIVPSNSKPPTWSHLPKSHWPVGLAGLLEFLDMTAEGWAEFGGEDGFSVGRDVVLDLLDRFRQLLDQPLA